MIRLSLRGTVVMVMIKMRKTMVSILIEGDSSNVWYNQDVDDNKLTGNNTEDFKRLQINSNYCL